MSNGNGMVRRDDAAPQHGITRALVPQSMPEAWQFAQAAAKSNLYAVKSPEAALMILSTGLDLGLGPSQALRGIDIIEGKPRLSADLMVAVVKARRDLCKYFRLVESLDESATWETWREGEPEPVKMTFTRADAEKAGLWGRNTWKAHARTMLRHRAASQLARAVYQDVLFGIYTPDEIDDIRESRGHEPAPPSSQRVPVSLVPQPPPAPEPGDAFEDPVAQMPDEAVSELETWRKRIEACATMSDLTSLKPQLAALPEAMRRELRPVFEARREELRKPTPPAGGGNRPANDAGEAKGEGAEGEAPADGSPQAYAAHLAALPHVNAVVNSAAKHSVHWGEDAGEYMAVAVREGKARGLSGETFRKRVAERIAQNEARAEKGQAA
jgi:hypothetical protein